MSQYLTDKVINDLKNIDNLTYNEQIKLSHIFSQIRACINHTAKSKLLKNIYTNTLSEKKITEFIKFMNLKFSLCEEDPDYEYDCLRFYDDIHISLNFLCNYSDDENEILNVNSYRNSNYFEIKLFEAFIMLPLFTVNHKWNPTMKNEVKENNICNNCIFIENVNKFDDYIKNNFNVNITFTDIINIYIKYIFIKQDLKKLSGTHNKYKII